MKTLKWNYNNFFFNIDLDQIENKIFDAKNPVCLITCKSLIDAPFVKKIKSNTLTEKVILVESNPSLDFLKNNNSKLDQLTIVAIGGGSVLDFAKILYWLCCYNYDLDIENIFDSQYINNFETMNHKRHNDFFIIPTTTGTGSECTPFSTIWDFDNNKKLSFKSSNLDYKVFYNTKIVSLQPMNLLIASIFDSLSHSLESLWNINSNDLSKHFSMEAIMLIIPVLKKIETKKKLKDDDFYNLSLATFFSGNSISMTETALCHSMSYPITIKYKLSHGLSVGFLLPSVMEFNKTKFKINFDLILNSFEFTHIDDFIILLASLFKNCGGLELVLNKINTYDNLIKLTPYMDNPSRSKNNIRAVAQNDIKNIINNLQKLYNNV
jgi:alcohol dehydrogenase class IV